MLFDSIDPVRAFAGDDYETAYVPPAAREILARFDEQSAHYETLLVPEQTQPHGRNPHGSNGERHEPPLRARQPEDVPVLQAQLHAIPQCERVAPARAHSGRTGWARAASRIGRVSPRARRRRCPGEPRGARRNVRRCGHRPHRRPRAEPSWTSSQDPSRKGEDRDARFGEELLDSFVTALSKVATTGLPAST